MLSIFSARIKTNETISNVTLIPFLSPILGHEFFINDTIILNKLTYMYINGFLCLTPIYFSLRQSEYMEYRNKVIFTSRINLSYSIDFQFWMSTAWDLETIYLLIVLITNGFYRYIGYRESKEGCHSNLKQILEMKGNRQ